MYDYANWIDGGAVICQDDEGVFYEGGRAFPLDLNAPDYGGTYDSTFIYKIDSKGKLIDIFQYSFYDGTGEYSEGLIAKGDTLVLAITGGNNASGDNLKFAFISKNDGTLLDTISIPSTSANYSTRDFIRARDGGFLGCGWKGEPNSNVMKTIVYKLAESGELEWMREFKHPDFERQQGEAIIENIDGSILVCGPLNLDALNQSIIWSVIKINNFGDSLSQREYLDFADYGGPNKISLIDENNYLVCGSQLGYGKILEIDSNLAIIDEFTYNQNIAKFSIKIIFRVNENYYSPLSLNIALSWNDPFQSRMGLAKFDSDFNMLWYKVYSGMEDQDDQYYYDAVQTSDGGIAMCGFIITGTEEVNNMWLVKVDSLGNDTLPLSNILPDHLYLSAGEDTTLTALTFGG